MTVRRSSPNPSALLKIASSRCFADAVRHATLFLQVPVGQYHHRYILSLLHLLLQRLKIACYECISTSCDPFVSHRSCRGLFRCARVRGEAEQERGRPQALERPLARDCRPQHPTPLLRQVHTPPPPPRIFFPTPASITVITVLSIPQRHAVSPSDSSREAAHAPHAPHRDRRVRFVLRPAWYLHLPATLQV